MCPELTYEGTTNDHSDNNKGIIVLMRLPPPSSSYRAGEGWPRLEPCAILLLRVPPVISASSFYSQSLSRVPSFYPAAVVGDGRRRRRETQPPPPTPPSPPPLPPLQHQRLPRLPVDYHRRRGSGTAFRCVDAPKQPLVASLIISPLSASRVVYESTRVLRGGCPVAAVASFCSVVTLEISEHTVCAEHVP